MPDTPEKNPEAIARMVDAVANKKGWVKNPDNDFRLQIEQGLLKTWNRYGYFLCPCRDGDGNREADHDIICPCAYASSDIQEFGHCFCGLYLSPDFAASKKKPQGIPERRSTF